MAHSLILMITALPVVIILFRWAISAMEVVLLATIDQELCVRTEVARRTLALEGKVLVATAIIVRLVCCVILAEEYLLALSVCLICADHAADLGQAIVL